MVPLELEPFPPLSTPDREQRRVLLSQRGGFWVARCPSLPGCATEAPTRMEAMLRIQALVEERLRELQREGRVVPPEPHEAVVAVNLTW